MEIQIKKARTEGDFKCIEYLANMILPKHYEHAIPSEDLQLFLRQHQSYRAIKRQVADNYKYFLLCSEDEALGYLATKTENHFMHINKLYILEEYRGMGIGKKAMLFAEKIASQNNIARIDLMVNRRIPSSLRFCRQNGFKFEEDILNSFGNSLLADNYRMEKVL